MVLGYTNKTECIFIKDKNTKKRKTERVEVKKGKKTESNKRKGKNVKRESNKEKE